MESNKFHYVYNANNQDEVKKIREKYISEQEDKMKQLRKLDESVTTPGMVVSLIFGVIGTLIFGLGLCCCLVWSQFGLGILLGLIGMVGIILAYPMYSMITKKRKEQLAPEIIKLCDELLK